MQAGLKLGMTLRPQLLTPDSGWNSSVPPDQTPQPYFQADFYLPDNSTDVQAHRPHKYSGWVIDDDSFHLQAYIDNIVRKAKYAISKWSLMQLCNKPLVSVVYTDRWNASMFYVDSCGRRP
jgi:hypothetical protein